MIEPSTLSTECSIPKKIQGLWLDLFLETHLSCRLWRSGNARRETLRVVVLDEKRREEVQKLVSLVYTLAEVRTSATGQLDRVTTSSTALLSGKTGPLHRG